MATIKMRRLRANMPDEGRNIVLVWEDRGNPMKDSEGNIIYTDVLGQNGQPLPLYKEFPVPVQIPYDLPATTAERTALITALKDQALEVAKIQAQKRRLLEVIISGYGLQSLKRESLSQVQNRGK